MEDTKDNVISEQSSVHDDRKDNTLHYASRGQALSDESTGAGDIAGFDAEWMRARTSLTADEEKKLLRRVDWHIMPLCAIMFLLKNIDSENVANAKIMNKGTDRNILTQLGMTTDQYNLVTVLYYISWGIALACHAAVKNKEGLYAVRFLLGLFEAGLFPGVILQLCYWYRPDEMSLRLLYFFSGSHGLSGWQWLFLTEGVITVAFGISLIFIFPDFPPQAKWLTDKEKAFIQARLPGNAPRAEEINFNFREILDSLRDRRLWLFTLIWAFFTVGTHGLRFYQPTVIANLGFTDIATSQLLNIPTSVLTVICIGVFGIWADSSRLPRPLYPLSFLAVILACYGVLYSFPSNGAVYAVTVIANALGSAWYPLMWPWRVQTTSRATGSAFSIGFAWRGQEYNSIARSQCISRSIRPASNIVPGDAHLHIFAISSVWPEVRKD
ncbi:permeases of the major facilitator [Aspergillus oryzae 100-8]|uniref:Permease of the major facilitator superfamily n=1 Tax=Aspergillus oryzae (strain 3.042) TaxID=1160506 RepID=I8A631_ASPO3|nr:permease of the major facilitator superfamily [Aspergillus oryzae 3.042]KDE80758.1 permeases of the major facilitator [Aspergillus oryzae 100-8]|eukprot:EIT80492.1 permease of the major facilitator superfamily [Aspergillus oryzae 3.042]